MWKNTVQPGRPQMIIWVMRITCWIPNATNTHVEYVILIAFPLQQWLHARASVLLRSTLSLLFVASYFKLLLGNSMSKTCPLEMFNVSSCAVGCLLWIWKNLCKYVASDDGMASTAEETRPLTILTHCPK